jgi:beta,beta-carotene 9',10'-dioxygenase
VRFHVIEKASGRLVRTARSEAFFAFHHVNAFEDGDDVVLDIVCRPDATIIDLLYLDRLRSSTPVDPTGKLTRFRVTAEQDVTSEQLTDVTLELPRFDYAHRAGLRHRFVYGAGQTTAGEFFDSLFKIDLEQHATASWHEAGCYPGEPIFVAVPGATTEDDGVILSVVLDTRRGASFLLVLNAATFSELARAEAPHHIPFSFHGQYFGAKAIDTSAR